eukprot:TRINITY_DN17490_c0_g2_i1.p1 TRINITY_DN17490_c0_g2~~TRINITY_DN17490_c0_g2_i1.p1  ORF type:complete len:1059 (-),score=251.77 TRINITY_DN17490_c0_g2_i1:131-3139(-)
MAPPRPRSAPAVRRPSPTESPAGGRVSSEELWSRMRTQHLPAAALATPPLEARGVRCGSGGERSDECAAGDALSDAASAALQRLQLYVFTRRIRVKGLFADYDKLHCGRCTRWQFTRAITALAPATSQEDVISLAECFTESGPQVREPQVVNYLRFERALEEVFTEPGLEKRPDAYVPKRGACVPTQFRRKPLPPADEDRVQEVLERIAKIVERRGIRFRQCFQTCDHSANVTMVNSRFSGKITRFQFEKFFPLLNEISESELQLLMQRYEAERDSVHFAALDDDVAEIAAELFGAQREEERHLEAPPPARPPKQRPQSAVAALGWRAPAGGAMAAARCGASAADCQDPTFLGAAQRAGQEAMSPDALSCRTPSVSSSAPAPRVAPASPPGAPELPVAGYKKADGVGPATLPRPWSSGPSRSASASSLSRPGSAPLQRPPASQPQQLTQQHIQQSPQQQQPPVAASQPKMHHYVQLQQQARVSSAAAAAPTTTTAAADVPRAAAAEVLPAAPRTPERAEAAREASLHLSQSPPSPQEEAEDPERYAHPALRRRPQSAPAVRGRTERAGRSQAPRRCAPPPGSPVAQALLRITAKAKERRLRLHDRFVDFDQMRKGVVTSDKMKAVLTVLGVELEPHEYEALIEYYWAESIGGDSLVRYRDLCADAEPASEREPRVLDRMANVSHRAGGTMTVQGIMAAIEADRAARRDGGARHCGFAEGGSELTTPSAVSSLAETPTSSISTAPSALPVSAAAPVPATGEEHGEQDIDAERRRSGGGHGGKTRTSPSLCRSPSGASGASQAGSEAGRCRSRLRQALARSRSMPGGQLQTGGLAAGQDPQQQLSDFEEVQDFLRKRLRLRRFSIRTCFKDLLKVKGTYVTKVNFVRVIDQTGFRLKPWQLEALFRKYCDKKDDPKQFNYLAFCSAMEAKTAEEALVASQQAAPYVPAEQKTYFDRTGCIVPLSGAAAQTAAAAAASAGNRRSAAAASASAQRRSGSRSGHGRR